MPLGAWSFSRRTIAGCMAVATMPKAMRAKTSCSGVWMNSNGTWASAAAPVVKSSPVRAAATPTATRKLNNKEQRELAELPARIEKLETEQAQLTVKLGDVTIYRKEPAGAAAAKARLDEIEAEHSIAFARWEELEAAKNG